MGHGEGDEGGGFGAEDAAAEAPSLGDCGEAGAFGVGEVALGDGGRGTWRWEGWGRHGLRSRDLIFQGSRLHLGWRGRGPARCFPSPAIPMKILIYTPYFYPSFGGIETVVSILAHQFVKRGHEVKLVSETPSDQPLNFPFEVHCRPDRRTMVGLVRWCDFYFLNSLHPRGVWPLLLIRRPSAVTHHSWRRTGLANRVKQLQTRLLFNVSISRYMASQIPTKSYLIPNPYRSDLFRNDPAIQPTKELVYLGRLSEEKGADLLIEALAILKKRGLTPKLTMIGAGPEQQALGDLTCELSLSEQVEFVGKKMDEELVRLLNQHEIMVVPTRVREAFGVVALEGIACGCVVVGSESGGLKEAMGPCGVTFPNEDVAKLADTLQGLLTDRSQIEALRRQAPAHLHNYDQSTIAEAYLATFQKLIGRESFRESDFIDAGMAVSTS
ncbi:MAG TPA: glycosyltransferase family 4 protein [Tepidisphaeraceae bacterium]|jgi:glycosyltransferase involved in cell wall biosynthesis|nr:glycosyltransferase family 4 protein [Tepidisphaeraceae bacterium]